MDHGDNKIMAVGADVNITLNKYSILKDQISRSWSAKAGAVAVEGITEMQPTFIYLKSQ